MGVQQIQVNVSQEGYAAFQGMVKFISAVKQALADGWQPGTDVPVVATAAFTDILPLIQSVGALSVEAKADTQAFIRAALLSSEDLAYALL